MFNIRSVSGELRVVFEDANVTRILRLATPTDLDNLDQANSGLVEMRKRTVVRAEVSHG
jgi:hypothetical protein